MARIIEWPICLLTPQTMGVNLVPFTRSGGRTLGGIQSATRTDLGFWTIDYGAVLLRNRHREQWQTWNAIRQSLGGKSGLIAVRVRSGLSAPYASGDFEPMAETLHDDDTPFDDETPYVQGAISIVSVGVTPIGATQIRLRRVWAGVNLVGVRFSYGHALYETGPLVDADGDVFTLPISPTVRATIPDGAELEFDQLSCICRLADDRGMDVPQDAISRNSLPSLSFVEATDYWADLAMAAP